MVKRTGEGLSEPKEKRLQMLKTFVTPVLIVLSLAGAASAQSLSADLQLASAAGVSVGRYTAAELQVISRARLDNDTTTLNFYLSGENRTAAGHVTDAGGQLAKQAGVPEGQYTVPELIRIQDARATNDTITLAYYLSGTNRIAPAPASVVTPGKAQLAEALHVDPSQYTSIQLVTMTRNADASQ